ncbi:MAG: acetylxylan esterase [Gammaproteobacteria bacterium]|nr:acetylxylan esterase [Gammaproteobacteria bacterium]
MNFRHHPLQLTAGGYREIEVSRGLLGLSILIMLCLFFSAPLKAQLVIFEGAGLTIGSDAANPGQTPDAVECTDQGTYRDCVSDLPSERLLSHDGLALADRTPLDFRLLLPPAPAVGDDGNYPLVVFMHGWGGNRLLIGSGLEGDFQAYAEAGYAVLAYSARAWAVSCGPGQKTLPECDKGWNHMADARYEVRDTQYFAGLLADELSDDGTPLVDATRIGVTGVSYGGGQSTILASLRNRVVEVDGTVNPWLSPAGKPMQIAAAAPHWAWTDLAYSLLPNGRGLDYVNNNSYFGPADDFPMGVLKASYVTSLYGLGQTLSYYAPPGEEPPIDAWYALLVAGEPYDTSAKPIADEVIAYHSGYYWLDPMVEPAPTLFNSGWSDDLFPVDEPLRWIHAAKAMHPDLHAALYANDNGHGRASGVDAGLARAAAREWFDYYLMDTGEQPGPAIRAKVQDCDGSGAPTYVAERWSELMLGEIRLQDATGGTVTSESSPGPNASSNFDPISGGNACARVNDEPISGALVYDLPTPDTGGYTVLGSPTIIADITVSSGSVPDSLLVARLLDIAPNGTEQLLARGAFRPSASGTQVFQLHPIAAYVPDDHHLQLEFVGNENPTHRKPTGPGASYTINITNLDMRLPSADRPNGMQIEPPAEKFIPAGFLAADLPAIPVPLPPLAVLVLCLSLAGIGRLRKRKLSTN